MRVLLGAFGDPGHAFPMIALGRALRARGHDVVLQTWERWREDVERERLRFSPAPEYRVFPTSGRPLKPYEAVVHAVADTRPLVAEVAPDVIVHDVLTLAPALCAELEAIPWATLIPHVDPRPAPGFAPYSIGARLPRRRTGARMWDALAPLVERGLRRGRDELNETRARVGLPALGHLHGGISRALSLVATFPQLEYPRVADVPGRVVIGPLQWEPPFGEVALPPGDAPLVLVAPSTSQDPEQTLLRAAVQGLGRLDVRVLATSNRRPPRRAIVAPANARIVEWLSYARTMPRCAAVVCHGGHGTVVRALSSGCAVVAVPAAGDMNENAARVAWAGAGVRVPRRMTTPGALRLAVGRALDDPGPRARAASLAAWLAGHDPGATAADLVERLARGELGGWDSNPQRLG